MKQWLLFALLAATPLAPWVPPPTDGPLTPWATLLGRTDENGYLRVSPFVGVSATDGPLTAMANLRVRTDENGYLRVSCSSGCSGGSGTPGGSDTQVQFNDAGSFGGDAGLTYVKATDALTLAGTLNKVTITAPASAATLTLVTGSSLITSGAFAITLTSTATTNVTLPASGNLMASSGSWTDTDFACVTGTTGKQFIDCGAKLSDFAQISGVAADDTLLVGNGTTYDIKAVGNCVDSGGNHLNYTAATNSFSCGTTSSTSGGNVSAAGTLTANALVLGAGVHDVTVQAGLTTDGSGQIILGVAGSTVGSAAFKNATSGTITLQPVTGALGSVTLSLPAATDTLVGKATTDTFTNKTLDVEGTGNLFTMPTLINYIAGVCQNATSSLGFSTPTTLAATAGCESGAAGGHAALGYANFVNTEIDEVQGHFSMPSDFSGAVDVQIKWRAVSTTANDVVWQIKFGCVATAEVASGVSFNTTVFAAVTNLTTTLRFNSSVKTGITTTGCAAGEEAFFIIFRDTGATFDTLDADVQLLSAIFTVRRAM